MTTCYADVELTNGVMKHLLRAKCSIGILLNVIEYTVTNQFNIFLLNTCYMLGTSDLISIKYGVEPKRPVGDNQNSQGTHGQLPLNA